MPGVALTNFDLDMSGPMPVPSAELTMTPYKLRNLGYDFETIAGNIGLRPKQPGAFRLNPINRRICSLRGNKICCRNRLDAGNWSFTAEYAGKTIPDFEAPAVDPIIGTEPDLASLALMMTDPGFDLNEYVRQQVGSFNRLYNYQIERTYHSAGVRIQADLLFGKITPSVFALYNFTSRDFLMMPELKYKPADGLTISAGGDFYSGRKGSINDLINEFMNCLKISVRVDF